MATILICDDDESIVELTQSILEDIGYQVRVVTSCDLVDTEIKEHRPDLILLDLWIPLSGGEEISKNLKKDPATKDIPIIIVSANKDTQSIAKRSGADDFLCKPYDLEELEQKVEKFLDE